MWTFAIISLAIPVVALLYSVMFHYVRRGCPYLIRGSAFAWATLYLIRWLLESSRSCENNTCPWWWLVNGEMLLAFQTVFWISLLVKNWWNVEYNKVMDMINPTSPVSRWMKVADQLPPLYPNTWIAVLESRDLPRLKAKTVTIMGQQLAVFRGEDGKAHVLDAYCPHLGANLGVGGRVVGNCLQCPFHGWQFRGEDGKCVSIPYAKQIPDVAKARCWTSCEVNGFIYVWHHAEGENPKWSIPEIPEISRGDVVFRGRIELLAQCHIQDLGENSADFTHFSTLHFPPLIEGSALANRMGAKNILGQHFEMSWKECSDSPNLARMELNTYLTFFNKKIPLFSSTVSVLHVGPTTLHTTQTIFNQPVTFILNVIPEGPFRHRAVSHAYAKFSLGILPPRILLSVMAKAQAEDQTIWANKIFYQNPLLLKEDKPISRYRRWFSQFYSEHSLKFKDYRAEKSLDW